MTDTHVFIPLLGKRIRVTALNSCGDLPDDGAPDSFISTSGFISLNLGTEVDNGKEIIQKRADGTLCVNEKLHDSFKRFTVKMEFCEVNPSLLALVTNAEQYADALGDIAGFTIGEGTYNKNFALELWTGMSGADCDEGGTTAGGYVLLPFISAGTIADLKVTGDDVVTFSLTGSVTKGDNRWGVGPYNVVADGSGNASTLPTALDPGDHLLVMDTGVAPPPDSSQLQPMPSQTTPSAPTALVATASSGQLSIAFTTPSSTGGSAITNYKYSTNNGGTWKTRTPAATTSPIVITGLTNGTDYTVKLRAVNIHGAGDISDGVTATPHA